MNAKRYLKSEEIQLIEALIKFAGDEWCFLKTDLNKTFVADMQDGEMGSLLFHPEKRERRSLGQVIAEAEYHDADGTLVSVTLNLDEDAQLFELDSWKVDFSKLQRIADLKDINFKKPGCH